MSRCAVCDSDLQPEQKTCHLCGSSTGAVSQPEPMAGPPPIPSLPPAVPSDPQATDLTAPAASSAMERECPACGTLFGASYQDEFCQCGTELRPRSTTTTDAHLTEPATTLESTLPASSDIPASSVPAGDVRPAVGTPCLVVYSESKPRQPIRYVPVNKDVILIGREDAIRGDFPELDLSQILNEASSRKISRRHAELLRARDRQSFQLRPLAGNTGTQVGKELATAGQTYDLTDGTPIVLGGVVWMKFEVIK